MKPKIKIFRIHYHGFSNVDFEGDSVEESPTRKQFSRLVSFWIQRFTERGNDEVRVFIFSSLGAGRGIPAYPWKFMQLGVVELAHFVRICLRKFDLTLVLLCRGVVVTIDAYDNMGVAPADRSLLNASTLYFKREGFVNPWMNLVSAAGSNRCAGSFELFDWSRRPALQSLSKMRTISLGIQIENTIDDIDFSTKSIDVFLAIDSRGLPNRDSALRLAQQLEENGFNVFISRHRMNFSDYLAMIRRSWIVLSPSGNGWDCFRHYEAAGNGALPIMDYPYIRPHRPFAHGVTCLYLSFDEDFRLIGELLADRDSLKTMISGANSHVRHHHTERALGRYVIGEILASLQAEPPN